MKKILLIPVLLLILLAGKAQQAAIGNSILPLRLTVSNSGDTLTLLESMAVLGTGVSNSIYFKTGDGTSPYYTGAIKTIGQNSASARIGFFTNAAADATGLTERMSILNNGKTGIGTIIPDSNLTVAGSTHITSNTFIGPGINTKLEINGKLITQKLQISSNAGAGKILKSDASGNGKWSGCGLSIGQNFAGGIIFYLDPSGCHGLVAAPYDQASLTRWDNGALLQSSAYASGFLAGAGNTKKIIFVQGTGQDIPGSIPYAAKAAADLTIGPYHDWYLPSKYELNLMFYSIGQGAPAPNTNIGGFQESWYWSSTELNSTDVWMQAFYVGLGWQVSTTKYFDHSVRAIRAF